MDKCITNRCYMCIQWKRDIHSNVLITWNSNPPISQFNRACSSWVNGQCSYTITKLKTYNILNKIPQIWLIKSMESWGPFSAILISSFLLQDVSFINKASLREKNCKVIYKQHNHLSKYINPLKVVIRISR